jgi:hypothetical protein
MYEMMNQTYLEAVFNLLPCMIGENRWEQLGKESQGCFEVMVTKTDEALLLWALDCYWNVVAVSPNIVITDDERPLSTPYYISEGNSTRKNQGWTELGKQRYNEYYKAICKKRNDHYWYGTVWKANFQARWEANCRRGRKTSDKSKGVIENQLESMDDLD